MVHAAQVLRIARLVDQLAHLPLYRQAFAPAVNPAVELLLDPQEHELSVGVAVVVAAAAPSFDDRRRVGANGGSDRAAEPPRPSPTRTMGCPPRPPESLAEPPRLLAACASSVQQRRAERLRRRVQSR